ncbi:MAG: thioredoxin domain-containing protein [Leucobacter sp.]|nr:thioredoxin domain-containing protein [Leucobacter sp.]
MSDEQQPSPITSSAPPAQVPSPQTPQGWVAVPPPHPHPAGQQRPAGSGLAIAAMALGLIALLSAVVAAFYFGSLVVLGGALGCVAIIVAIVALVRRSQPWAASLTGLIAGAIAMLVAIIVGALSVVAVTTNLLGSGNTTEGGNDGQVEEWTPDTPSDTLIEWPANMASGGIVFAAHGDQPMPLQSAPLQPGTAPQPHEVVRGDGATDILIYVDYRCPHCSTFEQANSELLTQAIADGATVEVVTLSFLDRASEGTYYSSRAAAAVACIVDLQPESAWAAHTALLSPAVQPGGGPGLSNEELVAVLDDAAGGLSPAAADCITTERFVTFTQALNSWVFANTVPNANQAGLRVEGTPLVLVNGDAYVGEPSDGQAFANFLAQQMGSDN